MLHFVVYSQEDSLGRAFFFFFLTEQHNLLCIGAGTLIQILEIPQ